MHLGNDAFMGQSSGAKDPKATPNGPYPCHNTCHDTLSDEPHPHPLPLRVMAARPTSVMPRTFSKYLRKVSRLLWPERMATILSAYLKGCAHRPRPCIDHGSLFPVSVAGMVWGGGVWRAVAKGVWCWTCRRCSLLIQYIRWRIVRRTWHRWQHHGSGKALWFQRQTHRCKKSPGA